MADDTGEIGREAAESVGFANIKNAEVMPAGPAFYSNLAMGNAVTHQQAMNQIALAATGSIVKAMNEVDPLEAISVLKATTGNDLAAVLAALVAAINANQQGGKGAQTTPPVTP